MSANDRQKYKKIIRNEAFGALFNNKIVDYTERPDPSEPYEQMIEGRKRHREIIRNRISMNNVKSTEFLVIGMKFHFSTDNHEDCFFIGDEPMVYPSEIALTSFNITEGVTENYTSIIRLEAENIPSGHFSTYKEYNEKHKIPLSHGCGEFNEIGIMIKKMIEERAPDILDKPIYVFSDDANMTRRALKFIECKMQITQFEINLQVLDDLFSEIYELIYSEFIMSEQAHSKLTESTYDFRVESCEYHDQFFEKNVCSYTDNLTYMYFFI
ncbi:MAG: hypothetical protein MHPSP_001687 [Paramarteilia canceri]